MTSERRAFLAVHDYGMGGVWMKIIAQTREEIAERYPQLTVYPFGERPGWMTDAEEAEFTRDCLYDLDDHDDTWLAVFDHEHRVQVERVYGTGDARDGYSWGRWVDDGSGLREQPGAFFIANCYCGWCSPMREDRKAAVKDGREHYPDEEPRWREAPDWAAEQDPVPDPPRIPDDQVY